MAGKAALNSVRAALSSGSFTGIKSTAKVAYWGYSGGSIPTGWAALLTKTYAPELVANNVGYALGGIVADINDVAKQRMGGAFSSLIITAINGLSTEYPELLDYINSNVYPDKLQVFTSPLATCASNDPALSNAAWSYFFKDGSNTLSNPVVKQVTTDNSMVNSSLVPTAPLFFYNSLLDEVIPPSEADNFYNNLCKAGVSVTYKQDLLNGHITESFAGAGQAFVWLQSVLNGKTYKGCSKSFSISNAASPTGLLGLGVVFAQTLTEIYVANFFNNIL